MTDQAVMELTPYLGVRAACEAVGSAPGRLLPTTPAKPGTGAEKAYPATKPSTAAGA